MCSLQGRMGDEERSGREPADILKGWSARASLQKVILEQRPAGGQGAWEADVGEEIVLKEVQVQRPWAS